jgi:glyoxylase-like metal-dependent hydrolase (beta-lactamase superfamily II)
VSQIFLTHGHDDHTGSAAALAAITGAAIVGPALDQAVIEGRARRAEPQLLDWEVPLFERYGRVPAAPAVRLDATVADGDVLDWERPAQVVGAPGHTAGSVALFFAEEGVLIAGDAIMSLEGDLRLGVFNADPQQAERTLCRLVELDPATVCVGHGPVISRRS